MVLGQVNLEYEFFNNVILIRAKDEKKSEQLQRTVRGCVKDEKGTPLPGVTVVLKGENLGVATDVNGNYSLSFLDQKNLVILFSFVGMLPVEVKYTGQDTINVVLKEDVLTFPKTPDKWKMMSTTTGTFINAGHYKVLLSAENMDGLAFDALDIQ